MAYAWEEDTSCQYLEVNEVIESTEYWNWTPSQKIDVTKWYLVFSPAQVTEHRKLGLEDQDVLQETKERFVKLKEKYPEVFSLNNQDIVRKNLVTMHVDTVDSPPICQKLYTLPLRHYS